MSGYLPAGPPLIQRFGQDSSIPGAHAIHFHAIRCKLFSSKQNVPWCTPRGFRYMFCPDLGLERGRFLRSLDVLQAFFLVETDMIHDTCYQPETLPLPPLQRIDGCEIQIAWMSVLPHGSAIRPVFLTEGFWFTKMLQLQFDPLLFVAKCALHWHCNMARVGENRGPW